MNKIKPYKFNLNKSNTSTSTTPLTTYFLLLFLLLSTIITGCTTIDRDKLLGIEGNNHIPRKFGATYMTMDNPYFVALNERIREEVEANGDILITRDPAQNQEKQNDQIFEMINDEVVAIFVNPVDWKEIGVALKACSEAGIPVFNIDTYVYHAQYIVSSIVSDNYDAGVQIAEDVMKKKDHAKIVIINDDVINSTKLRVKGFLDTIKGYDGYEVVIQEKSSSELELSMEKMNEILKTGVEFDVALGGNDPTALGILASLQMNHSDGEVLLYGVDGSPDGKAMVENGLMEGTSAQFPYNIGKTACDVAYQYLSGKAVERTIKVPVDLITTDNLAEYDVTSWQ
ncbi:MAG TPA: sugar ABC transporter substrate-binding protein [Candidatus Merdenecus merdavium]|nr:sugar ABC transporter substrate-binding protein [Candidatus Merdenecus merdavium]